MCRAFTKLAVFSFESVEFEPVPALFAVLVVFLPMRSYRKRKDPSLRDHCKPVASETG